MGDPNVSPCRDPAARRRHSNNGSVLLSLVGSGLERETEQGSRDDFSMAVDGHTETSHSHVRLKQ